MINYSTRLISMAGLLAAALLAFAYPAAAINFTVHDWDLGERIELTDGRRVYTAELAVSLGDKHGTSFCVDLDTDISRGSYEARDVFDAYANPAPVPVGERPRRFAWAGHVMNSVGHDVSALVAGAITRDQAITGVQAAIWEGIYGGGVVNAASMSDGAREIFDRIMGSQIAARGTAVIVEFSGHQDQVFSNPVPEPTAAMVFGVGLSIVESSVRRKSS